MSEQGAYAADGYGIVKCKHVHNMRDLGGLLGADGRAVRGQRLVRSSALGHIDEHDADVILDENVRCVVDLRTKDEREGSPDRMSLLPGVAHVIDPVLSEAGLGVSFNMPVGELMGELETYERDAVGQVVKMYRTMIESAEGQKAFRTFLQTCADTAEGAVLFHCTEGKDRTGLCAVMVERALGVSDDDIRADYLASNKYCEPNFEKVLNELGHLHVAPKTAAMAHTLFTVRGEYLDAAYDSMEKLAGGIDGYVRDVLGVDDGMRDALRAAYLEQS